MLPANRSELGKKAEDMACAYLRARGFSLLQANYRCYHGEIDLIMRDQDDIVFVEVRSRNRTDFGTAGETINYHKKMKLIKAAMHFLQRKQWLHKVNSRFDVIAIHHAADKARVEWFKNAFIVER